MSRALTMTAVLIWASAVWVSPGSAADQRPIPIVEGAIEIMHCELEFDLSAKIGANSGVTSLVIQECNVKLGDKVKAGQVLGRLSDSELRARLALLEEVANNDIDVRVAESKMKEASQILKRLENLRQRSKSYTSDDEYGKVRLEAETATLEAEQAKHRRQIAKLECLEVKEQIKNRAIVSPHDGTVVEIFKKVGETSAMNEPIFEVVNTDVMKVTGFLNLEQYGEVVPGQDVQVYPDVYELNVDKKKATVANGKVFFVDRRVDPKTRTSKIVALITNAGPELPSGVEAQMIIFPKKPSKKPENAQVIATPPGNPTTQPLGQTSSLPSRNP